MPVDFYGYSGDCTVSGRVELGGQRLSEFLEAHHEIEVGGATLHGLKGEAPTRVNGLTLLREELFAAEASIAAEPAVASRGRRIHTVRHVMRFLCGPYTILGEIHVLPGAEPLRALMQRRSMVPLTDCAVLFTRSGQREIRRSPVIVVNAALIERAEPARVGDLGPALAAELANSTMLGGQPTSRA